MKKITKVILKKHPLGWSIEWANSLWGEFKIVLRDSLKPTNREIVKLMFEEQANRSSKVLTSNRMNPYN